MVFPKNPSAPADRARFRYNSRMTGNDDRTAFGRRGVTPVGTRIDLPKFEHRQWREAVFRTALSGIIFIVADAEDRPIVV